MSFPITLTSLSPREAIQDTLFRVVGAFDEADVSLLESSFTQDGVFDLAGTRMEGLPAIQKDCYDRVSKLDTTHYITNIRIDIADGGSKATAKANGLAYHWRAGQGNNADATRYISGSTHVFDMVKDTSGDLWRIKEWKMNIVWTEGDAEVMSGN